MSPQNKRYLSNIVISLALVLSVIPVVAADDSPPLSFLAVGRTYILKSAPSSLPSKVKIIAFAGSGQWYVVEYTPDPKTLSAEQRNQPNTKAMYINFATVSGVWLWDDAPKPTPEKKEALDHVPPEGVEPIDAN